MRINSDNYVQNVMRTAACDLGAVADRATRDGMLNLIHAGIGMVTEAGEFVDMLKKALFYGRPLDEVNLVEELGDVMWYVGLACSELGVELNDVMQINIDKLAARYPEKFSEESATVRDLERERAVLEGGE